MSEKFAIFRDKCIEGVGRIWDRILASKKHSRNLRSRKPASFESERHLRFWRMAFSGIILGPEGTEICMAGYIAHFISRIAL